MPDDISLRKGTGETVDPAFLGDTVGALFLRKKRVEIILVTIFAKPERKTRILAAVRENEISRKPRDSGLGVGKSYGNRNRDIGDMRKRAP